MVAHSNPKKNNKKPKKSIKETDQVDAYPSDVTKTTSSDKKLKNDKNTKKQQQQQTEKVTTVASPQQDGVADYDKQNTKSRKQKVKKENKKALKKQQQQQQQDDDNNKNNASFDSEDISLINEKRDAPKFKNKLDTVNETRDKLNAYLNDEKVHVSGGVSEECTLVSEIAKARQHLKNSLERMDDIAALAGKDVLDRISALEKENASLHHIVGELKKLQLKSEERIKSLESRLGSVSVLAETQAAKPVKTNPVSDDDDDDVDLFNSDEEDDAEAARIREERVAAYAAKKSKKPALIAKSSVLLDVKPWDDETDMKKMEEHVRTIVKDGLVWGASKLVPVGYGINKLQIMCVIEDDKISIDELQEKIESFEDYVQSVDIAAFNKI